MDYGTGQRAFKDMSDAELRQLSAETWPPAGYANWPLWQRANYMDFTGSMTRSNSEAATAELARRAAAIPIKDD